MHLVKFSLLKRRRDIDRAAFSRHWSTRHVEVLLAAGHRSYNLDYVQNHFFDLEDRGYVDDRFDGAAQLVQRSGNAGATGFQDDPRYLRDVRPDERRFLEVERACALFTRAVSRYVTARPRRVKVLAFFALRAGAERRDVGTPDVDPSFAPHRDLREIAPLVSGYAEYHTIAGGGRSFTPGDVAAQAVRFDGVTEVAFEDDDALKRALDHPGIPALLPRADWDVGASCRFLARAKVIYDESSPA